MNLELLFLKRFLSSLGELRFFHWSPICKLSKGLSNFLIDKNVGLTFKWDAWLSNVCSFLNQVISSNRLKGKLSLTFTAPCVSEQKWEVFNQRCVYRSSVQMMLGHSFVESEEKSSPSHLPSFTTFYNHLWVPEDSHIFKKKTKTQTTKKPYKLCNSDAATLLKPPGGRSLKVYQVSPILYNTKMS